MSVSGLTLHPNVGQRGLDGTIGWTGQDREEAQTAGVVLGAVAAMLERMAVYTALPLRYPLRCLSSRSAVLEHPPPLSWPRYTFSALHP